MTRLRKPYLDDGDVIVYAGDCIEVMRELPEASVDAVVTDPPYELGFMGKAWDGTGIAYQVDTWAAALRVLKPGGHLLAFSGTRTYHRMTCAIEDAGFEIRDCIAWMYGSGFPKSLDVSKAIDKAAGVVGSYGAPKSAAHAGWIDRGRMRGDEGHDGYQRPWMTESEAVDRNARQYEPATPEAEKWHGWGTALKPAYEPVVVARKPLTGTVAENVLTHGTGVLNIDACRIAAADPFGGGAKATSGFVNGYERGEGWQAGSDLGRWPANVALDETAATILDQQSGECKSPATYRRSAHAEGTWLHAKPEGSEQIGFGDTGGASRFFYTAKASRQDRNVGGLADNTHPTVKPTDLMRWLIRLVTPPGGIILDPFGGSGSTGLAARAENVRCILIEREDEYLQIISDRLAQLSLLA